jgi:3alpha(or 20beta)-hydroxysteroid dehydrogenase
VEGDRAAWTTSVADHAGILRFGTVEEMPVEEVELLFRVNQLGCWLGMQAVVPDMRANGGVTATHGFGGQVD